VLEAETARMDAQDAMDSAIQEKISLKIQAAEKRERVDILNEENKNLRLKLQDLDEEVRRSRRQIKQL